MSPSVDGFGSGGACPAASSADVSYRLAVATLLTVQPGEQTLADERERFRLLVENVKDYAILMLDPEGRIVSWNSGAERIKGYRAEEAIGRHFSMFYTREAVEQAHPERELEIARREGRYEEEG